ncbi:MAG: ABC transporter permease [Planctomycetota bacterium]
MTPPAPKPAASPAPDRATPGRPARWPDAGFWTLTGVVTAGYLVLLLCLLAADVAYLATGGQATANDAEAAATNPLAQALADPNIRYSIHLTLVSCTITAVLSVMVATPIGYLLARARFPGKALVDTLLDIPIVLPPLVIGLSLLILFQYLPRSIREAVVYQTPAVVLSQFVVASAFAIRAMRVAFDQIDPRLEQVARTLGASRLQALGWVVLPEAGPGLLTAGTLAWARSLGEFGPLLVFAGATRGKTEVLSTTVFLELSIGNLQGAVAVSLLMIFAAVSLLTLTRLLGGRRLSDHRPT